MAVAPGRRLGRSTLYLPRSCTGYDGSEVIGHCISPGYNNNKGKAAGKLNKNIERAEEGKPRLMLWDISNHGGDPSEIDLQAVEHQSVYETV